MEKGIVIQGARQNNLKNINLTLPRNKLIVFTGLSGSGKSSLAFDTLFAEANRRCGVADDVQRVKKAEMDDVAVAVQSRDQDQAPHRNGVGDDEHDQRSPQPPQNNEKDLVHARATPSACLAQGFADQQDDRDQVGDERPATE